MGKYDDDTSTEPRRAVWSCGCGEEEEVTLGGVDVLPGFRGKIKILPSLAIAKAKGHP
jgi:hypothetical protein